MRFFKLRDRFHPRKQQRRIQGFHLATVSEESDERKEQESERYKCPGGYIQCSGGSQQCQVISKKSLPETFTLVAEMSRALSGMRSTIAGSTWFRILSRFSSRSPEVSLRIVHGEGSSHLGSTTPHKSGIPQGISNNRGELSFEYKKRYPASCAERAGIAPVAPPREITPFLPFQRPTTTVRR